MDELTRAEIAILDHTATRATAGMYCGDSPAMQELVAKGLMRSRGKVSWCPDEYFAITDAGREALKLSQAAVAYRPPVAEAACDVDE